MITINAIMKVNPAQRENYLELVKPLVEGANNEPGSLFYQHFEQTNEPNTFAFIERYEDEAAVEAHNNSAHFQQFFKEVSQYLVEKPEIKVLQDKA
ncbi:antibiotic biosynthesis monooxygenase [Staphylococcus gallinarum]|uniref:Signal transduction protein TRAP n=1 Tax=Staphylococcus gallinarum TaxID=1293 RepID=A0A0D0SCW4_STAGA|nr:putative quinol monooxygenase [Staphylococcus gallinarum]KIR10010.1 monooxygenase [Staphylococcus gallinarum]RTX74859.1 antibiotic biosynthesis monooxygenase [Staphylococcus gallinarum]GEQ05918.1 monooxygenase [Staphylococcus gallinarum]SUM34885.1 monooxygenase family protein [Staphylococcus gallinarum]